MLWLWFVSGLLILLFAWGLTCFLNRKYKRLMLPHRLLRTLRNALRSTGTGEDVQVLRSSARILTEHLLLLQR